MDHQLGGKGYTNLKGVDLLLRKSSKEALIKGQISPLQTPSRGTLAMCIEEDMMQQPQYMTLQVQSIAKLILNKSKVESVGLLMAPQAQLL